MKWKTLRAESFEPRMDWLYSDLFRTSNQEIVRVIAIWLLSNGTTVVNKRDTRTLIPRTHTQPGPNVETIPLMDGSNKSEKTFSLSRQISKKEKLTLCFGKSIPGAPFLLHTQKRKKKVTPHHSFILKQKKKKIVFDYYFQNFIFLSFFYFIKVEHITSTV